MMRWRRFRARASPNSTGISLEKKAICEGLRRISPASRDATPKQRAYKMTKAPATKPTGICAFCDSDAPLRESHVLPAFVFRRSEEHTSELQSLMRTPYAVFCLNKKKNEAINTRQKKNK